jgi:hypothetical protein
VFKEWMSSDRFDFVDVQHNAKNLLPKENKELAAFCAFARFPNFQSTIARLIGTAPGNILQLEILSSSKGEDPPDMVMTVGKKCLAIEVTDFPPDQAAMLRAITETNGPAPLPAFHEGACSPTLIKQFMTTPVSHVTPHFSDLNTETLALYHYADTTIRNKDAMRKCDLLLLYGPLAFSFPVAEVVDYVTRTATFKSVKAIVFILPNEGQVYWTNLA